MLTPLIGPTSVERLYCLRPTRCPVVCQATPLYAAAEAGDISAVRLLLRAPTIALDQCTCRRTTPLNVACRFAVSAACWGTEGHPLTYDPRVLGEIIRKLFVSF